MLKEYKFNLEDEEGKWKVKYESKPNKSRVKRMLIRALWNEFEGLTVRHIVDKISLNTTNIPTVQEVSNILSRYDLFSLKTIGTSSHLFKQTSTVMVWKLDYNKINYELM